jgi:hypothetical protein
MNPAAPPSQNCGSRNVKGGLVAPSCRAIAWRRRNQIPIKVGLPAVAVSAEEGHTPIKLSQTESQRITVIILETFALIPARLGNQETRKPGFGPIFHN